MSTRADSRRSNTLFQKNVSGFGGSEFIKDNLQMNGGVEDYKKSCFKAINERQGSISSIS